MIQKGKKGCNDNINNDDIQKSKGYKNQYQQ